MSCPGSDGLACIDGWLYSGVGGMVFPANKQCKTCNPPPLFDVHFKGLTKAEVGDLLAKTKDWGYERHVISETLPEKKDGET